MTTTAPSPPRKYGCWFYGCTTLLVVVLVGLVLAYFGARYAVRQVEKLVRDYTDTNAVAIERVVLPPEEWTNLQQRVAAFGQALESAGPSQELVLTERDLNALVSQDPKFKELQNRLHVLITNDIIGGEISYPLPDMGPLKLQGRYLNGTATFAVKLQEGELDVRLRSMEVKGEPLPKRILEQFQKKNLAEEVHQDQEMQKTLSQFESIQIEDGKVILKSKAQDQP